MSTALLEGLMNDVIHGTNTLQEGLAKAACVDNERLGEEEKIAPVRIIAHKNVDPTECLDVRELRPGVAAEATQITKLIQQEGYQIIHIGVYVILGRYGTECVPYHETRVVLVKLIKPLND
jgi:hypothetical protein